MGENSSTKELGKKLKEAGNKLIASPPSSVTHLISTLYGVENLLTLVEQSPPQSLRKALTPLIKALIANELLRHSDVDVKVAVASCMSEITRITAPNTPYDDDKMKEVFKLIVSTFEKLDDRRSPSYIKRMSILETVAKVRLCLVMLDLQCDALIAEMFHHFFMSIRSEHPEFVFSSMEKIMTLVLEESEDVSVDLVSSILNVLKTENKEVLPVARQLGEKVMERCYMKIEPCLEKAMEYLHTTQDDYPKIVANVLKKRSEATETRDAEAASKNVAGDNLVANESTEKTVDVAREIMDDAPSKKVVPSIVRSPKSVVSNVTIQKENGDTTAGYENAKEANNEPHGEEAEPGKTKVDNIVAEEPMKSLSKAKKVNKQIGKKSNSLKSSSELSQPLTTDDKEGIVMSEVYEKDDEKDGDVQNESPVVNTAEPAETGTVSEVPVPSPKTSDEPVDVPSPSASESLVNEKASKKAESVEKKDELMEDLPAADIELKEYDVKKSAEEASASEPKSHKGTGENVPSSTDMEDSAPSSADVLIKEDDKTSELDAKSAKPSGKKVPSHRKDRKKRGQGKITLTKDPAKSQAKDEGKKSVGSSKSVTKPAEDESDLEKNSKRKHSSEKKAPKYGEELVGSKVKVWWPDDRKFYAGVIKHYDPSTKKHKVTYDDGDVEVLKLENETWKLVDGSVSNMGNSSDDELLDETAEMTKAKKAKKSPVVAKQGKTQTSAKKGRALSSKSKVTSKSQTKQKEDDESKPSEGNNKSKEEPAMGLLKSKAKSHKSGTKPNSNSKTKAAPLAEEEDEEMESSPEPVKAPENAKGKLGSESQKSSTKRKRSIRIRR